MSPPADQKDALVPQKPDAEMVATSVELDSAAAVNYLGPINWLIAFSGLNASACGSSRWTCGRVFHTIIPFLVMIGIFARLVSVMMIELKPMSLGWAETNLYAFMALHAFICSIVLRSWTKNRFVQKYQEQAAPVRALRIEHNSEIDQYNGLQKMSFIYASVVVFFYLATSIFLSLQQKTVFDGPTAANALNLLTPILVFFCFLSSSVTLMIYAIITASLNREIEYFNKELEKALENKELKDTDKLHAFSYRQKELIKLVRFANDCLGNCVKIPIIFLFISIVNGIYIVGGFGSETPVVYFIFVIGYVVAGFGFIVSSLNPAANVQNSLLKTSEILMNDESFEKAEDQKVYQTYRIMVDRSQMCDAKIYVANAIALSFRNVHKALIIIPNFANVLLLLKRLNVI